MEISLNCPINKLSYGYVGVNILKELTELGHKVNLFPIHNQVEADKKYHRYIHQGLFNAQLMADFYAPCVRIFHQFSMLERIGKGKLIGFPIFELDSFSVVEKHHLDGLDEILVCSEWAKSIIVKELQPLEDKKEVVREISSHTHVVPLGVDRSIFYEQNPKYYNTNTVFFTCGKWELRKSHDIIIECFNRAFDEESSVELWMMCANPFLSESQIKEWENLALNSKLGRKISIIPRVETQEQLAEIMVDCDVFLGLSHAEGWNLELLEALSMGKNVICTDYSAHTEFCNKNNANLIQIDALEDAYDGIWFTGQGKWGEIGENQKVSIVENMRRLHRIKQDLGQIPQNKNGIETAERFSWTNTAQKLVEAIS